MHNWKLLTLIILILSSLVIFPASSYAADFRFKEEKISIQKQEVIDDDLYIGAGDIIMDGVVNGDLFVFGGQVKITGEVKENLFIAGGQVIFEGNVGKNLRVVGGNVIVKGKVGKDLLAAGGNVEIDKEAEILKDVKVAAGQLVIAGTTGSVQAKVGSLTLQNTANVVGNLSYISDTEASMENGVIITGGTVRHISPKESKPKRHILGLAPFFTIILSIVVTILMALLFLFVFPHKSEKIALSWRERFGLNILWGFLFLIAVPVAVVILFITIIGFPLGIAGILLYIVLLYLGKITGIISLAAWFQNLGKKEKELKPNWLFVIFAVIFYSVFKFIPFVGWLGAFLIFLAGLGAMIRFDLKLVTKLQKDKTF